MKATLLARVLAARAERRPVAVLTRLADGAQSLIEDGMLALAEFAPAAEALAEATARLAADDSGTLGADGGLFLRCHAPPVRLILIGAVHISQALAPMAALAGLSVGVIDPRPAFATPERFPGIALVSDWPEAALTDLAPDGRTAVVALCHDPRLDDPALAVALRSPSFYIGALGSRRTHAKRLERLAAQGFAMADLARVDGPVGLPLGGRSAGEIAVSILAGVVKARHALPTRPPAIAAIVLAAGASRRMGEANKLLLPIDGMPMVARTVRAALRSRAGPVVVVTGHQAEAVAAALAGLPVTLAHNPEHAAGMASSLRRGLAALPAEADGAVVCLGDMPWVEAADIDALIEAFDPARGREVCAPVHAGRRGNPVLWGKRLLPLLAMAEGDSGGRALLERVAVHAVPRGDNGTLRDIDTAADFDG